MLNNTIAVFNKTIADLKKICTVTNLILQIVFICSFSYFVVINLENTVRLIIYSVLLVLSIGYFVFFVVNLAKDKKFKKDTQENVRRSFKFCKLFVQAVSIGFTIYELMHYGASDLSVIIVAATAILFVFQLLLEIARIVADHYITMLTVAIERDVQPIKEKYEKVLESPVGQLITNPQAAIFKAVNKPIGFIAKKLNAPSNEEKQETAFAEYSETPENTDKLIIQDNTLAVQTEIANVDKEKQQKKQMTKREEAMHSKVAKIALEFEQAQNAKKAEEKTQKEQKKQSQIDNQKSILKKNLDAIASKFKKTK